MPGGGLSLSRTATAPKPLESGRIGQGATPIQKFMSLRASIRRTRWHIIFIFTDLHN